VKFGVEGAWILISGDADRDAFEKHITAYHRERLSAFALGASHHGSRTFFKCDEDDDPYLEGIRAIDPVSVIVSAPTQAESCHGHPHDDAMELYENHVGEDHVHHTGEERYSFIVDIYRDGTYGEVTDDGGRLSEEYGLGEDDGGGGTANAKSAGPFVRPKQETGDRTPRKYG
jgi:hypothetical protein